VRGCGEQAGGSGADALGGDFGCIEEGPRVHVGIALGDLRSAVTQEALHLVQGPTAVHEQTRISMA